MKKPSAIVLLTFLLGLLLNFVPLASQAQCVMCKTQVEAARGENDDFDAAGLNRGILYMMTVPYLLIGAVGYFWYRRTHPKVAKS
jgi:hypothetical protein